MGQAAIPMMLAMYSGAQQNKHHKAAAKSAEAEGQRAAAQEEAQIREEQIERRERLIQALSAQNARVGASGGKLSGSALNIMETDQQEFEQEDRRGSLVGSQRVDAIRAGASNRAAGHRSAARISLIDSAVQAGQIGASYYSSPTKPTPKKTGTG